MKSFLTACLVIATLFACGNKTSQSLTNDKLKDPENPGPCADSLSQITFVNNKTVELRLGISEKTSVKEGNTIVNTWRNKSMTPIPVGDSLTLKLKKGIEYMYTVYGPVSTNVTGLGEIGSAKFTLEPCEKRMVGL
jgi:hypothetical protein